jgi:hypothetical protein
MVEFLGPTCVGKTTLRMGVYRRFNEIGVGVIGIDQRRMAQNTTLSPWSVAWCAFNYREARSKRGQVLLKSIASARSLRRSHEVILFDEGPLKIATWLISDTRLRTTLARAVDVGQLAVQVDCDPAVRLRRVRVKNGRSTRGLTDRELIDRHTRHIAAGKLLVAAAGLPMLCIDTTDEQDHSEQVADWIMRFAEARASVAVRGMDTPQPGDRPRRGLLKWPAAS